MHESTYIRLDGFASDDPDVRTLKRLRRIADALGRDVVAVSRRALQALRDRPDTEFERVCMCARVIRQEHVDDSDVRPVPREWLPPTCHRVLWLSHEGVLGALLKSSVPKGPFFWCLGDEIGRVFPDAFEGGEFCPGLVSRAHGGAIAVRAASLDAEAVGWLERVGEEGNVSLILVGASQEVIDALGAHPGDPTPQSPLPVVLERPRVVSRAPSMEKLFEMARNVARTLSTVLLSGEPGVGKELLARHIHAHSSRASKPFVTFDCAALPNDGLVYELFGREMGTYVGPRARHLGLFERANGGTIVLEEISALPLEVQTELLRVLQDRSMVRVGGREEIELDVRVIATTRCDLRELVDDQMFRLDLYYRLNVFPLKVPPLRERPEDIEVLTNHYLDGFFERRGVSRPSVAPGVMQTLLRYPFPGNLRELHDILERAIFLAEGAPILTEDHLVLDAELVRVLPAEALSISLRAVRNNSRDPRDRSLDDEA